jgi:hypothetical protein
MSGWVGLGQAHGKNTLVLPLPPEYEKTKTSKAPMHLRIPQKKYYKSASTISGTIVLNIGVQQQILYKSIKPFVVST